MWASRKVKIGYKVCSGSLCNRVPPIREIQRSALLGKGRVDPKMEEEKITEVSLPFCITGYALPVPNLSCLQNKRAGFQHRVAGAMPPVVSSELRKFRMFVRHEMKKMFKPLPPTTDVSFETWLADVDQKIERKCELQKCYEQYAETPLNKIYKVKSFLKYEGYDKYKYPRCILARSDYGKCLAGPWCKAMEKEVFSHKYFIKKIPIDKRPDYVIQHIEKCGFKYLESDYTSWEAGVNEHMMEINHMIYRYLTKNIPGHEKFWAFLEKIRSINKVSFKNLQCKLLARRCSGEMDTSLGNGLLNCMVTLYTLRKSKVVLGGAVFEGDDGLVSFRGDLDMGPVNRLDRKSVV